ncbi:hypothetical protein [Rhodococcoides kroppenstedtii]|uniref:hypothetical protein n=1 Tax=Rhodococcoides kroppenstedtii TaxID=293050 RepID=UPI00362DB2F7
MRVSVRPRRGPAAALAVTVVALATTILFTPTSAAQDTPAQDSTTQDSTANVPLSFAEMGLGGSVALTGQRGRASVTLPVPDGTSPVALRSTLEVPAGIERGWLDVTHDDRFVGRVDLGGGVPTVPVVVPLTGVPVIGRSVSLDLSTTIVPTMGSCLNSRDSSTVRLQDPVVDYAGAPTSPTTVADFLPPVLRTVTLVLPDEPTADQATAALTLAAAVVDRYGSQPVRTVVRRTSDRIGAPADGPFDRTVVVAPGADAEISLEASSDPAAPPALIVSGDGPALLDQVALIGGEAAELAVADRVVAGPLTVPPVLTADSMTLGDMGLGPQTQRGSGEVTVTIPVDQTRLGRAGSTMRVHVLGTYTPLSTGVAGNIHVAVGDRDLDVRAADGSGVVDTWVDVPAESVERVTPVDVTLRTTGNGDACSTGGALTLTIDSGTTVTTSGGTPDTQGFASVPQSLMPTVDVALAQQTFANTARAITVLTGLQRLSARPLIPTVVPFDDVALSAEPAVVVAPDGLSAFGPAAEEVRLPLGTTGTTVLTLRGGADGARDTEGVQAVSDTRVTVDSTAPFASLQVLRQNGRTLVVATSTAAAQLDEMLAWLTDDARRWDGLRGDVLFGTASREPVSLSSVRDAVAPSAVASGSTAPAAVWSILVFGAVALVVGLVAAALVYVRSHGRPDDGPSSTDGP